MAADPACTDPDNYQVIFENDRVRVLEYRDLPGDKAHPHAHPDSVMYTLSAFQRRLRSGRASRDVVMEPGLAHWLPAQTHAGENIGSTPTHALFVELKGGDPAHNAEAIHKVLRGEKNAFRDIVVLNSAAALMVAGKAADLKQGAALAIQSIDSGKAKAALATLKRICA